MSGNRRRQVNVRIDELVLDGFAPAERYRIGGALERELARLLAVEGLPAHFERGGLLSDWNAGSFSLPAAPNPEMAGARIAQSVYRRMKRP